MGMAGATVTLEEVRDIVLQSTNAPKIKEETMKERHCEEIEKKYDAELARGFSVEALIGKTVAQMEKASCQDAVRECIRAKAESAMSRRRGHGFEDVSEGGLGAKQ